MGSKRKIAKYILPIILKNRIEGQWYVEPFVGGCNIIDKVDGKRIGNDINNYLIDFWKAVQNGFVPPDNITLEEYKEIKENKEKNTVMTLWAGICCSYGGKWFGGYINDYKEERRLKNGRLPNHQLESKSGILKQSKKIKDVVFSNLNYWELKIPKNSIIYCDPPYENTTSYKNEFNHVRFWEWCRQMSKEGHEVFISEYSAPLDFECISEIVTNTQLGNGSNSGNMIKIEKLFIYKPEVDKT